MGCMPPDHAKEIGVPKMDGPDRITGYDHRRFYRNLVFGLATDGY